MQSEIDKLIAEREDLFWKFLDSGDDACLIRLMKIEKRLKDLGADVPFEDEILEEPRDLTNNSIFGSIV